MFDKALIAVLFVLPSFLLSAGSANADALEGKKSPAEILEQSTAADWRAYDPENLLVISLERGPVVVALSEQLAPKHVARVKELARSGFYDGLSFYRVIDGFVAQGGDVFEKRNSDGAHPALKAEFDEPLTDKMQVDYLDDKDGYAARVGFLDGAAVGVDRKKKTIWALHCTGAFAFGRENEKDTASTEFYITIQPQRYLDRNLSVFGKVVDGMEHVHLLRRVAPAQSEEDDLGETIISMRMASDLVSGEQPKLEYLKEGTDTFRAYVEARRNRPEAFFHFRPDHLDVCALNVPVRARNVDGE